MLRAAMQIGLAVIVVLIFLGIPVWIDFRHWWPHKRKE
jgi:hypothetical protein